MEVSAFLEQVLLVIVLYRQRLEDSTAFESLEPLMQKYPGKICVFVYDNSEEPAGEYRKIGSYLHDPKNSGVSRAYNRAWEYAKQKGLRFLMLMDQDSHFPETIFRSYSDSVAKSPGIEVFAPHAKENQKLYSPFRFVRGRGTPAADISPGIHALSDLKLINSGLLVSVNAFEKCGGYDERFPLDFSDIVFCDRLFASGFDVYVMEDTIGHKHSSSRLSPPHESRQRFEKYLNALALYGTLNAKVSYWRSGLPRAARLAFQLRDKWFLRKWFSLR